MTESDHDILIELRTDVKYLINAHEDLKGEFHKECLPRLSKVENQQVRWMGRDGAIVAGISGAFTFISVGIAVLMFWRH
jgi:phosphoserine phosphatase